MFDSDMLFRDMETQEVFVFDRDGIWNKDAVEHQLINWNKNNNNLFHSLQYTQRMEVLLIFKQLVLRL